MKRLHLFAILLVGFLHCHAASLPQPIVGIDFDSQEMLLCGLKKSYSLPEKILVPGKFGKGAYFQRPAYNSVPRDAALPSSVAPFFFQGNAEIRDNILHFSGSELAIRNFPVRLDGEYVNKFIAITASCEVKSSQTGNIHFCLDINPWTISDFDRKKILEGMKRKDPLDADQNGDAECAVGNEWKRIVVTAQIDARTWKNRSATLRLLSNENLPLELRHFQVEQTGNSPYNSFAPTEWLPGLSPRPDIECGLKITEQLLQSAFSEAHGTFSWWAKMPEDESLGKRPEPMPHMAFAGGWRMPAWTLKTNLSFTGEKSSIASKAQIPVNKWMHFAVVWSETENRFYVNGKLTNTSPRTVQNIEERGKYILSIGRSIWPKASSDAMLDEIYLFDKALSDEEIGILANPEQAYHPEQAAAADSQGPRVLPFKIHPLFRDTTEEFIALDILASKPEKIKAALDSFEKTTAEFSLKKGKNTIHIPIHPRKASPHSGKMTLSLTGEDGAEFYHHTQDYEVRPALRKELLRVLSWGGDGETPLEYLQKLGVNSINTIPGKFEKEGTRLGMTLNLDFRNHRNLEENNFDPVKTLESTSSPIDSMRGCYNWEGTLVNSEAFGSWKPAEWPAKYPELVDMARKNLPGGLPEWNQFSLNPFMANLSDLPVQPDANGIFPEEGKAAAFLRWYMNEGNPVIQENRLIADYVHAIDPQNTVWTEPADSYGVFKGMDMGGIWAYVASLQEVAGKMRRDWAMIRNGGCKAMQPTVTMYYWINSREKANYQGKEYILTRSPERLQADCWVAAGASPMHNLCFFNAYAWYDAEMLQKKYLPAQQPLQAPFGKFMKERFYPAALLLRDTQEPPATVALCIPPEIKIYSEKSWNVYRTTCMWERNLALYDVHFDVLFDATPFQRDISSYKTAIFPMATRISKDYEAKLQEAAETCQIVVDEHCTREYPNMLKLHYTHNPAKAYHQDSFSQIFPFLEELARKGSGKGVEATGSKGRLLTYERLCNGIRLILVINNAWCEGAEYSFALDKKPRDFDLYSKGIAQTASVRIHNAADSVIYDFHEGKTVSFKKDNDAAQWNTELAPGDARLFCVYPKKLQNMKVSASSSAAGEIMNAEVNISPAVGRQILWCEIRDAKGALTDESGWYVAEKGSCVIPVRIPLDAPTGKWSIELKEHTSGLKCRASWNVATARQ